MAMKKGMAAASLATCAACICLAGVALADQALPRMDRSKLLIGAYCFREAAHDEAHVRDLKACGIDFVTGGVLAQNVRSCQRVSERSLKHQTRCCQ